MKIGKSLKKSFELRNDDVKNPDNSSDSFRRKNHKSRQKAKNRSIQEGTELVQAQPTEYWLFNGTIFGLQQVPKMVLTSSRRPLPLSYQSRKYAS